MDIGVAPNIAQPYQHNFVAATALGSTAALINEVRRPLPDYSTAALLGGAIGLAAEVGLSKRRQRKVERDRDAAQAAAEARAHSGSAGSASGRPSQTRSFVRPGRPRLQSGKTGFAYRGNTYLSFE